MLKVEPDQPDVPARAPRRAAPAPGGAYAANSRILLPVDFSERSVGAAHFAGYWLPTSDCELVLMHVLVPPQYEFGAVDIAGSMLAELCRDRVQQANIDLAEFRLGLAACNVRRVVLEGDPSGSIVDFAHNEHCDLIVMPTHGYGPFRRFILGSNTAKVLHDADCPVWTGVHLEDAPAALSIPIRTSLCAVDLGPQSCKALAWAASLAREFGARSPCCMPCRAARRAKWRPARNCGNCRAPPAPRPMCCWKPANPPT
jgi:nucleotide-binding universal stress UspA family protein